MRDRPRPAPQGAFASDTVTPTSVFTRACKRRGLQDPVSRVVGQHPLSGTAGPLRTAPNFQPIKVYAATLKRYMALPGSDTQTRRPASGLLSEFVSPLDISATFPRYY